MDREQECVCCHEIERIASKNEEVFEHVKPTEPYDCITDNPGFYTVCLDRWVLQAAWLDHKQQYGSRACKLIKSIKSQCLNVFYMSKYVYVINVSPVYIIVFI